MSNENYSEVTVANWMVTFLLLCIPFVNIIMIFVWAFGGAEVSKSNWAKATLLWMLISIVLAVVWGFIFGTAMFASFSAQM